MNGPSPALLPGPHYGGQGDMRGDMDQAHHQGQGYRALSLMSLIQPLQPCVAGYQLATEDGLLVINHSRYCRSCVRAADPRVQSVPTWSSVTRRNQDSF